jgi:hypothetical protein
VSHNHVTRDIKPEGKCPGCDDYHERVRIASDPERRPPGPSYPPTHPFRRAFG